LELGVPFNRDRTFLASRSTTATDFPATIRWTWTRRKRPHKLLDPHCKRTKPDTRPGVWQATHYTPPLESVNGIF